MANASVSVEDFIGHLEDLIKMYQLRIKDLKRIAGSSHGNARTYRLVKLGQAEELEQCVLEINKIITWFRGKRANLVIGERAKEVPGQLPLFEQ